MLYQQQPEWGDDMAQDLGDVVDKLLDFWDKHHKKND
jgi:hypothetical protein